jgi:hypothetical protein
MFKLAVYSSKREHCTYARYPTSQQTNVTSETHVIVSCLLHPFVRVLPAVISPQIWVPFPAVPFPIHDISWWNPSPWSSQARSHISREKKPKWACRKWSFNDMVHPKARNNDSGSHIFCVVFWSFMTPGVGACVSKRVPDCSLGSIQFIFEVWGLK